MALRLSALRAGRPLPPGRLMILIYVRGLVDPRAIVRLEELVGSIEKSNYLIGNWTHDRPACSIVPQPTTLPRVSPLYRRVQNNTLWLDETRGLYWTVSNEGFGRKRLLLKCRALTYSSTCVGVLLWTSNPFFSAFPCGDDLLVLLGSLNVAEVGWYTANRLERFSNRERTSISTMFRHWMYMHSYKYMYGHIHTNRANKKETH
jgi:hypothetical protein